MRSICVISQPQSQQQQQQQSQQQQQQQVAGNFANLPPKKIRYAQDGMTNLNAGNGNSPPVSNSSLLFASKSSVPANVSNQNVMCGGNVPTMIIQQPTPPPSRTPSSSSTSNHIFNASIQQQGSMQLNRLVTTSVTSDNNNSQNAASKTFVPNNGSKSYLIDPLSITQSINLTTPQADVEQNYAANILLQQHQYAPTPVVVSSSGNGLETYQSVNSSNQSGSQFTRVPNVSTTVVSSQANTQIFFNSPSHATNVRLMDSSYPSMILTTLQPASVQQCQQTPPSQQQQQQPHQQLQQQQSQAIKSGTLHHKILLHPVPVTNSDESINRNTLTTATLISLDAKQFEHANGRTNTNGAELVSTLDGLRPSSIILSPSTIIQNTNIPGSQASRTVTTNFAVPIPVVTSAISDARMTNMTIANVQQHRSSPTAAIMQANQFGTSNVGVVQSSVPVISCGGGQVPPLATKSTKMPSSKIVLKGGNQSAKSSVSLSSSSSGSMGNYMINKNDGQNI